MNKCKVEKGDRFGRLTIIKELPEQKWRRFLCVCDCGNKKSILLAHLWNNKTMSCGCLASENTSKRMYRHGQAVDSRHQTTEYKIWSAVLRRCRSKGTKEWMLYGGRGITVCNEWLDFVNFFRDMGERPGKEFSIERIDNNLGYSKQNCKWATSEEQANNRRTNHLFTFNGTTKTIAQWSRFTGISYNALHSRIQKKWSAEKVFGYKRYVS